MRTNSWHQPDVGAPTGPGDERHRGRQRAEPGKQRRQVWKNAVSRKHCQVSRRQQGGKPRAVRVAWKDKRACLGDPPLGPGHANIGLSHGVRGRAGRNDLDTLGSQMLDYGGEIRRGPYRGAARPSLLAPSGRERGSLPDRCHNLRADADLARPINEERNRISEGPGHRQVRERGWGGTGLGHRLTIA